MYTFKTKPKQHQIEAFNKAHNKENFAYLCEMGTGKTKMCIDDMHALYEAKTIDAVVVIAPKGVYANWLNELETHSPKYQAILWNSAKTSNKSYLGDLSQFCLTPINGLKYFIINVEALSRPGKALTFLTNFIKMNNCAIVIDESTCIKNPKAKRTKAIIQLRPLAKARRILTGSPVTNSPLNLYSQFEFLSKRILGYSSFYGFRADVAIMKQMNLGTRTFNVVQGYDKEALYRITKRFEPHAALYKKSECLDLPEKIYYKRYVELSDEQRKDYNQLAEELMITIDNEPLLTVNNVLTKIMKLHQIACGFLNYEEGIKEYNSTKFDELENTIDEMSGKIIIWSTYIHNLKQIEKLIQEKYPDDNYVMYYGDVDQASREDAIEQFQNNPNCRFFIGNPQTAGYGLTLTAAENEIYFSNSYDIEKRQQSEDRAHRIGQTKSVNIVDIVARDTVDETILKSLVTKKKLQDIVVEDGWKKALQGGFNV